MGVECDQNGIRKEMHASVLLRRSFKENISTDLRILGKYAVRYGVE
jgi:hypothetical protein